MLRDEQASGLSALLFGQRWRTAAWRAFAVFVLGYVLPVSLMAANSRMGAFLQWLATVLAFVLTAGALYKLFQSRAAEEEWVSDVSTIMDLTPVVAPTSEADVKKPAGVEEPARAPEAPARVALETLGQAALERLSIALYQFNGLHSQTIATGVEGAYRIRLAPRNSDKPFAILQCHSGTEVQGVPAYQAVLRAMEEEGLEKAFFVAPAGFTEPVSADARARHVTLVDLKLLEAMIDRLPDSAKAAVLEPTVR